MDDSDSPSILRSASVLTVGGGVSSPKLLLGQMSSDALLVYDSRASILRLFNTRTWTQIKESGIGARQILALSASPLDDCDLVTASPAGLHTWRDAFIAVSAGPLRYERHVRTPSLSTCLCTVQSRLVVGAASGFISIYGLDRRQPLVGQYDAHEGRVVRVLTLGGTAVASAANDTVQIWDVERFTEVDLVATKGRVRALAYSPRTRLIALGSDDRALSLWAPNVGTVQTIRAAHPAPIVTCLFRDRTPYLLSVDRDGLMKIWDCRTFGVVRSVITSIASASVAIINDSVVVVGSGPSAFVYELGDGQRPDTRRRAYYLGRDPNALSGVSVYCVRSELILRSVGRGLLIWSAIDGGLLAQTSDLCVGSITAACLGPFHVVCVGDQHGHVSVIDIETARLTRRLPGRHDRVPVRAMLYVPARNMLYTMATTRHWLCVLEHRLGGPYQVRRLRFTLPVLFTVLSASTSASGQVEVVVVAPCGRGARIESGGRRADVTIRGGHGSKAVAGVLILAGLRLFASVSMGGIIYIWSWDDHTEPRLVIETGVMRTNTKRRLDHNSGPASVMAYSVKAAILCVASGAHGVIDCIKLEQSKDELTYRRLGTISTRTVPVQHIDIIELPKDQIGVLSQTPWKVEFYSIQSEFLGSVSSSAPDRPVSWTLSTLGNVMQLCGSVTEPELPSDDGCRSATSQSITGKVPVVETLASLPRCESHLQVQHSRIPDSFEVRCNRLAPDPGSRVRRPSHLPKLQPSASEPWMRCADNLNPLLPISKTAAVSVHGVIDCSRPRLPSPPVADSNSCMKIALHVKIDLPTDPLAVLLSRPISPRRFGLRRGLEF